MSRGVFGQNSIARGVTETLREIFGKEAFPKGKRNEMKVFGFTTGMALGMAAAAAAVTMMYPDVGRRMKRDGKHVMNSMKKLI